MITIPKWYDDAKLGIMIDRGPYSVAGFSPDGKDYAEWYPRRMYQQGKNQEYHEKRFGLI